MKHLTLAISIVALAACSQGGGDQQGASANTELMDTVEGAGQFDYASVDGTASGRMDMREDGTYTDFQDGQEPRTGTWYANETQTCFTDDAEGSVEVCWDDSEADENGAFTSTSPDGAVVNVSPVLESGES